MRIAGTTSIAATILTLGACGGSKAEDPDLAAAGMSTANDTLIPTAVAKQGADTTADPEGARRIATIEGRGIGPFFATTADGGLAAFVSRSQDDPRATSLFALPLDASSRPLRAAREVARIPGEPGFLTVASLGPSRPFAILASHAAGPKGDALRLVVPSDLVATRPKKALDVEIARSTRSILWGKVVPTTGGAIAVWATEGDDAAEIVAVPLSAAGVPSSVPTPIARGVVAWQAATLGDGAAVGVVRGTELSIVALDAGARPSRPSRVADLTGDPGFDLVATKKGLVVAYTDASGADPTVALAPVSSAGVVGATTYPIGSVSGAVFASIAPDVASDGVYVAWDEPGRRGRAIRRFHVARVGGDLSRAVVATTFEARGGTPELVPTPDGLAILGPTQACVARRELASNGECPGEIVAPTIVRFDASLAPTAVTPLRASDGGPIASAWGLACGARGCSVLESSGTTPTPIWLNAPKASSAFALARPAERAAGPRATRATTIAAGESFGDLAFDPPLLATITTAVDDGVGKRGATIEVRPAAGASSGPHGQPISARGLTEGGIALAKEAGDAPKGKDPARAVAWVAREANGRPHVHVTRVGKDGTRGADLLATNDKGDAGDVAIVGSAGGGFTCAWIDARDGNGEVYAAKVTAEPRVVGQAVRLTNAPGDAGDVALFARGDTVFVAWADPRDDADEGFADVFVRPIRAKDATPLGPEVRVIATAAHSRSPIMAADPDGDGVLLAWIEEAPDGATSASTSYGALVVALDRKGVPVRAPVRIAPAGPGPATGIAIASGEGGPRGVVVRAEADELWLDAVRFVGLAAPSPTIRATPLFALDAPPSWDPSVTLVGDHAYAIDAATKVGETRVRDVAIEWGP